MGNCQDAIEELCCEPQQFFKELQYQDVQSGMPRVGKFEFPELKESAKSRIWRPRRNLGKGLCYEGEWCQEKMDGKGAMQLPRKWKYVGYFKQGLPHYYGRFYDYQQKSVYEGEVANGKYQGKGKIVHSNGQSFVGTFEEGAKLQGKLKSADGTLYNGKFKNNLKHDQFATQVNPDGSIYRGSFFQEYFHGKGSYNYGNGRSYQGDFSYGKKHGQGVFKWQDGSTFSGSYVNDLKQGFGQFRWNTGILYIGNFWRGSMKGEGYMVQNGVKKKVFIKNGQVVNKE